MCTICVINGHITRNIAGVINIYYANIMPILRIRNQKNKKWNIMVKQVLFKARLIFT